jgi:hypothetical protein
MRTARGKKNLSGFGVADVRDFDTLGQQALAPTPTAPAEDRPPSFGFHSGSKTELSLARALAWLVGAFHCV